MFRVVLAILLCSCAADDQEPVIDEVSPARIDPGVATTIEIHGRNFYGRASVDLGDKQPAYEDNAIAVNIGQLTIPEPDVSRQSSQELSVQLPAMSEGLYDVVLTLSGSQTATLAQGLRVGPLVTAADAGAGRDGGMGLDAGGDAGQSLTLLETVIVPTNGPVVVPNLVLEAGVTYVLRASGTFDITGAGTLADAEYADFSNLPGSLLDSISGVDFGIAIDDSTIDMTRTPKWGAFDISHIYQINFDGTGNQISVNFHDANAGNNTGTLTLEIMRYL